LIPAYEKNNKFFKYFKEYQWSNILAMIRNNRRDPGICTEDFAGISLLL
jgi:retinol dehydrogenase 13